MSKGKKNDRKDKERKKRIKKTIIEWVVVIGIVLFLRSFFVESFLIPTGSMEDTYFPGDLIVVNKFKYGLKVPFRLQKIFYKRMPRRGEIIAFVAPFEPEKPYPPENYIRILFPKFIPLLPLWWDKQNKRIIFYAPKNLIKRCIAVAGDTVEVRNKVLYINGKRQEDDYAQHKDYRLIPGLVLPKQEYQRKWENREFKEEEIVRDNFGPVVVPEDCFFAMGDNRDFSYDSRYWGAVPYDYLIGTPLFIYFSLGGHGGILQRIFNIRWNRIGRLMNRE